MKKLILLACLFFVQAFAHHLLAQPPVPPPEQATYFDKANWNFYNYVPDDTLTNTNAEGAYNSEIIRTHKIWGTRLYPHGDLVLTSNELNQYACEWQAPQNSYDPQWTNLGFLDDPSNSATDGVGQIHRIAFDHDYLNNHTVYAATAFGGLWRSEDDGTSWANMNTDNQLPLCGVADVATHPSNSDIVYISTGDGDYGVEWLIEPYVKRPANPTFTSGVYRCTNATDDNPTWTRINGPNNEFCNFFIEGGTCRRMAVNPQNPDQLFVATSKGIIRTNKANSDPSQIDDWTIVLEENFPLSHTIPNQQFRGLEFFIDPNTGAETVFASGIDIYKSTDGGDTWNSMAETLIDNLHGGDFDPYRINIDVVADENSSNGYRLYAYLIGRNESLPPGPTPWKKRYCVFVYMYNNGTWGELFHQDILGNEQYSPNVRWLAIAANPIDPDMVFFGKTIVLGTRNGSYIGINDHESAYNDGEFHCDVHALEITPDGNFMFCGNHGGVSVKDLNFLPVGTGGWEARNNKLAVGIHWGFDQSEMAAGILAISSQDLGNHLTDDNGQSWISLESGDGFSAEIVDSERLIYSRNNSFTDGIHRSDFSGNGTFESEQFPYDPNKEQTQAADSQPKIQEHPFTDSMFWSLGELYLRKHAIPPSSGSYGDIDEAQELWDVRSDIGKHQGFWSLYKRRISHFEISEADPDYIYVAIGGTEVLFQHSTDSSVTAPGLFLSTTGGCPNDPAYPDGYTQYDANGAPFCFKQIDLGSIPYTTGLQGHPVITCLAISPINPDVVYVTFSGYDKEAKVWKWTKTGETATHFLGNWTNMDPNYALNNLPVNAIVYQKGTDERLYIGTDAGIYIKDGPGNTWEKYGDFPNVRTVELKANYNFCLGKLRAVTFGRGLWEGDMLPGNFPYNFDKVIDKPGEVVIWDNDMVMRGNLLIKGGSELRIVGSTLSMPEDGKITIEKNAALIVDNSTITNTCGINWEGIMVQGDEDQHQYKMGEDRYQGYVEFKNGSLIENAVWAVRNYDPDEPGSAGGIIKASDTEFLNSTMAVIFAPYQNYDPWFGTLKGDLSSFSACTFLIDDDYWGDYSNFRQHVNMTRVTGIEFYGCSFINGIDHSNYTYADDAKVGINSRDADFLVSRKCIITGEPPCTSYQPSKFQGFATAIQANNFSTLNTFRVSYTEFLDNYTGINAWKVDNIYVVKNSFSVGMDDLLGLYNPYRGIQLRRCTGYKVEENMFTPTFNVLLSKETVGVVIQSSWNQPNEVYKDTLIGLDFANLSNGDNRGPIPTEGLVYRCNTNQNNQYDFAVPDEGYIGFGIAEWQGALAEAAGNQFSQPIPNQENNFLNHASPITYFCTPAEAPQNYTITTITVNNEALLNNCPSRLPTEGDVAKLTDAEKQAFRQDFFTGTESPEKFYAANMLIRDFLINDSIQEMDSVRTWLTHKGDLPSHFAIVDSWLQEKQPDSASVVLNAIPTQFDLSDDEQPEYNQFNSLKSIQISALQAGKTEDQMVTDNQSAIQQIAESGDYLAAVQAQSMINSVIGPTYEALIVLPVGAPLSRTIKEEETDEGNSRNAMLIAVPNPAKEATTVEYRLPDGRESGMLIFTSFDGRVIEKKEILNNSGKIVFSTANIPNGVYFYTLMSGDKKCKSLKLVVTR